MRPETPLPPRIVPRAAAAPEDTSIESPDEIQRWTARRRAALVLAILKSEMTVEEVAHRHGLAVSEIEDWKLRFLAAAHNALRSRPRDEDALKDDQIRRLKQKVGELVLEVDRLRESSRSSRAGLLEDADD